MRGYFGIMEQKMEAIGIKVVIQGIYWDNSRSNGNYYNGVIYRV